VCQGLRQRCQKSSTCGLAPRGRCPRAAAPAKVPSPLCEGETPSSQALVRTAEAGTRDSQKADVGFPTHTARPSVEQFRTTTTLDRKRGPWFALLPSSLLLGLILGNALPPRFSPFSSLSSFTLEQHLRTPPDFDLPFPIAIIFLFLSLTTPRCRSFVLSSEWTRTGCGRG
jgi:hypothetical protein